MAYATLMHVEAHNPQRGPYTPATKPSATQVTQFLQESAGVIDMILSKSGYDTPVTGAPTSTQLVLQDANAVGAWYKAEWAAPASDRRKEAEDMWQSAQSMLKTARLPGLDRNESLSLPRGAVSNASPPYFTRDMVL